jgi:hypothetical protein
MGSSDKNQNLYHPLVPLVMGAKTYNPISKAKHIKYNINNTKSILNTFTDKIYCINLERRPDRLEHITKEFNELNFNYKIFNAIDGQKLSIKDNSLKRGMIGATRSHVGVIKDAIKNKYEKIVVFEDDIIFCDNF